MITLAEARVNIGRGVIYVRPHCDREVGAITSVNERFVFVRYRSQHPSAHGKATDPADLEWETP